MDELEERVFAAIWSKTQLFPDKTERDRALKIAIAASAAARNYFEPMLDAAVNEIVKPTKQLGDRRLT